MRSTLQAAIATLIMIVGLLAGTATAQPYTQSPYLDERVASGELPPLEERLPETPMVYEPISEVGVYGGTFNVFAVDNSPWNDLTEEPARGGFMLEMTPDGEIIPGIALDFEQSEDFTTFTLYLRPGMQWSNGDPFTSEDFMFTRTTLAEFAPGWTKSAFGTPDAFVETPDDYTVIMHLGDAIPRTLLNMVHWRGGEWSLFHPSNYLKTWHPDFNEDAEALAAEEGFDTWQEAFNWHREFNPLNDVNKPTTQPWMPMEFTTTARLYERNPYFHQVDTAGQQLPYVDRVLSQTVNPETYTLKIVSGEADLAYTFTTMEDFTLYKENEEAGNYVIKLLPSFSSGEVVYFPNLSHPDPVRRELFNTAEFRRALSIAIDRDEINDVIYSGFAKPLQWTITEFSTFYQPEWGEAWAQFDPDLANSMLDELGLSERNSAGIRLTSDGNPLTIVVEYNEGTYSGAAGSVQELVSEYWGDIGIDTRLRPVATGNLAARRASMEWDVWSTKQDNGEMYATILGGGLQGFQNRFWELWREAQADIAAGRKTLEDFEGGVLPGEEPPAEINALLDIRVDMKVTVFGSEAYTRLATDYFQVLSDNTYAIGTVGQLPFVIISRPNVGNLNDQLPPWIDWGGDLNHYGNQWFYRPE